MNIKRNLVYLSGFIMALIVSLSISDSNLYAQSDSKSGKLHLELSSISPSTFEQSFLDQLGSNQYVVIVEWDAAFLQFVRERPVLFGLPARLWIRPAIYNQKANMLNYQTLEKQQFIFVPQEGKVSLGISSIPTFDYAMIDLKVGEHRFYKLQVSMAQQPGTELALPPADQLVTNQNTTQFTDMDQQASTDSEMSAKHTKKQWFKMAKVGGFFSNAVKNKYVKWGGGALLLSAGGYFGYQLIDGGGSGSGSSLPTPPTPPVGAASN